MQNNVAISAPRIWLARALAVGADGLQIALLPASIEGVFSPLADGIDFFMAVVYTLLIGWHIAFIPSFVVKLLPFADLAPTWTIAVLIATRGRAIKSNAESPLPELDADTTS